MQNLPKKSPAVRTAVTTVRPTGRTIHAPEAGAGATVREAGESRAGVPAGRDTSWPGTTEAEALGEKHPQATALAESGPEARVPETEALGGPGAEGTRVSALAEQRMQTWRGGIRPTSRETAGRGRVGATTVRTVRSLIGTAPPRRKAPSTRNTSTRSTRASHSAQIQRTITELESGVCVCVCVCECACMYTTVCRLSKAYYFRHYI